MQEKKRVLMVGAGGMAGAWIRHILQPFQDRIDVVGLIDINEEVLNRSGDYLGLSSEQRFTDMARGFGQTDADMCIIVIPPAFHKEAVLHALQRNMAILSEKPIADTWEASVDVYRAVKQAGVKMAITQNYRYTHRIITVKEILTEGSLGRINYIVSRFAADYRKRGAWGTFRHEISHSLLVEGAVHHFDQIRHLSGSDCATISGFDWNPSWSSFDGECCGLFVMEMTNGVKAVYEGSGTAAATQNDWHREMYRIECEHGAISVTNDQLVRITRRLENGRTHIEEIHRPLDVFHGHITIVDHFLKWLDGGPAPSTELDDNIKTAAMLFAAIQAAETRSVVDVTAMLAPLNA